MTSTYDYVIVGDGIAARCVLYYLSLNDKMKNKSILQLASEEYFPSCSNRTTSVVSFGLHERGISDLGDLICDSLECFDHYLKSHNPAGAFNATQYSLGDRLLLDESFYEIACSKNSCVQIHAEIFLKDLKERALKNLSDYHFQSDVCLEIDQSKNIIKTKDQLNITFSKLILCTGAYSSLILSDSQVNEGKAVSGSYYQWDNIDYPESFVLSKGHFNVIYRKEDRALLFGGTSFEGIVFVHNKAELDNHYNEFIKIFQKLNLPDRLRARVITGLRHKGKKRMPQLKSIGDITFLNCLYKNGFSFPFYLAKKLVTQL